MAFKLVKPTKQLSGELESSKERRKDDPSLEAGEWWGRGRPTFDQKSAVLDAQFTIRVIINPATGQLEERRQVSIPLMRQEAVWQFVEDGRFGNNWVDEEGNPLRNSRRVLNEYVDPTDLEAVGEEVLLAWFPDYFGATEDSDEAEEEGEKSPDPTDGSEASDEPPSKLSRAAKRTPR